jgi:hypothetical protein
LPLELGHYYAITPKSHLNQQVISHHIFAPPPLVEKAADTLWGLLEFLAGDYAIAHYNCGFLFIRIYINNFGAETSWCGNYFGRMGLP